MVKEEGWNSVAQSLDQWSSRSSELASWTAFPYNYPPLALAFFYGLSLVSPSVLAAKLLLTLAEAANAYLCFRITKSIWVGILYWCLPLSIWWISREGQIEPLQNLLVLAGLRLIQKHKTTAFWAWTSACLVKASAVFLAPLFIAQWLSFDARRKLHALYWILIGTIPLVAAALTWPVFAQVLSTATWPVSFNAWHWRSLFDSKFGGWYSIPYLLWMRFAVLLLVAYCLYLVYKKQLSLASALPIAIFIAASALMGVFQGWYFVAFIPFLMLATTTRSQITLIILCQLCDPQSVYSLFVRPVGWGTANERIPIHQPLTKP